MASKLDVGGATGIATGALGALSRSTVLIGAAACCAQPDNKAMPAILTAKTYIRVDVITFSLILVKLIAHPKQTVVLANRVTIRHPCDVIGNRTRLSRGILMPIIGG